MAQSRLWFLLTLLLWPKPRADCLPLIMDSVIQAVAEMEQKVQKMGAGQANSVGMLLIPTHPSSPSPLHHILLESLNLRGAGLHPDPLSTELRALMNQVTQHHVGGGQELGVVLAPDGSTVAVRPLLLGLEAGGQKHRVVSLPLDDSLVPAGDTEGDTLAGFRNDSVNVTSVKDKVKPPTMVDSLLAVTLAAELGLAFLQSSQTPSQPGLGTEGCWDQLSVPQTFTLLDSKSSPLTMAFLNGALDGILLGDHLSHLSKPWPPLSHLLRQYYGAGVDGDLAFRSNFRRQKGAALISAPGLARQVLGALILLQRLEPGHPQLYNRSREELAQVASYASEEFTAAFLGCPAIHPRCRWGAAPYRGRPTPLQLPLGFLFVHHTLEPARPCTTFEGCSTSLRHVQNFHQDVRGWDDIGYSSTCVMEPPPRSQDSQPVATSPLSPYRWHIESGREKGSGGSRWGLLASWGRALSHQEPPVSSQPARRSLFRRVLSAPPKESRTSRLRLSRTLWGRHKSPSLEPETEPEAPEPKLDPQPESPVSQIPEAPSPDVAVWDIGGFTLLDGKLMLLGGEEESPRRPRAGSGSSEGSTQAFLGRLRDPDRTPGKTDLEASGSNQVHNVRGLLKRIKEKKKIKSELGASALQDGPPIALGSRESLSTLSELDLGAEQDVQVWPLHPSLLGEPYCFQVTWVGGSRCFSCRSGAERDRWVEDLRRQFQPSQDNSEREETWLSVWVHEAKGLPRAATGTHGVRTELWLDGALLARTAPRSGPSPLFWSERFHFEALPPARRLSLRLRSAGPAGAALGRVSLELDKSSAPRAPTAGLERWFPLLGAPSGAALRARIRARRLRVRPSERYKELAEFLTFHYARLCGALEPVLPAQAKEELAAAMVRVLRATGQAQALVTDLGTVELERCGGREALLFRENTLATKAIDEYMKLVAHDYLQETLGQVVRCLCVSTEDCEVDPSKCPASELPEHQARLQKSCEEVFEIIIHSYKWFPEELSTVFSAWREACKARGCDMLGPRLVCASLFLRLLCPAILAPSLFGLAPEHPAPGPARTLTLIAKVIQNLANHAPFGEKEAYMNFMNSFLEDHGPAMQHFLDQVAVVDVDATPSGYQASGNLALQLAVLHAQLCTIFAELDQTTCDNLEPLPTILRAIEEDRPVPVSVPMHLPPPHTQVHSSFSVGEKPGFLAPRDLPKHTPLISKSQSLRSFQGAGSWVRRRQEEERPPPRSHPVQRTQSVPARRPARRRPSAGARPRPRDSLHAGPTARGRPRAGASASLPRKPSVPWQRQLDQPRAGDQALGTHRRVGKLVELQDEVAALREEQKALSRRVESLSSELGALAQQLEQLRSHLQDLNSGPRAGTSKLDLKDGLPSNEDHRLKSLHDRLADIELTQVQLRDVIQNLQLVLRTTGLQSQPLLLELPSVNGDTT